MAIRESEIGQGLLTLNTGSRIPEHEICARHDSIHVLCIDLHALADASRQALSPCRDEQLDWLSRAAERGRSLVVLQTDNTLEFYTTERDRRATYRPVVESMAMRVRSWPQLGRARCLEQTGITVARHLFRYAAEVACTAKGNANSTSQIHGAAALSAASAALGPTLASLFRAAANVGRRVRQETLLKDPNTSPSLREVESLAAERIVEEELATWQAQEAEVERAAEQLPHIVQCYLRPFESQEPSSEVRLRVGMPMSPRISYLPVAKEMIP